LKEYAFYIWIIPIPTSSVLGCDQGELLLMIFREDN